MTDPTFAGDYDPPAAWWRLDGLLPLVVRMQDTELPHLPRLAFADQFDPRLSVYGTRYIDCWRLTHWDPTRPDEAVQQVRRASYLELLARFPRTFTTVVGGTATTRVTWLVLPILQLTDPIADAFLARAGGAR